MKNNPTKTKYVTEATFKKESEKTHKEFKWVHGEFDRVHQEFDKVHQELKWVHEEFGRVHKKIDNVAHSSVKTQDEVRQIKETMATKDDVNLILNRFDHLFKTVSVFDQEEGVQSLHLQEVRQQVNDHERRLAILEATR